MQHGFCSLSNQPPHHSGLGEGPAVLVGYWSIDVALKKREHWKPNTRSATLLVGTSVGQCMVIQEESCGDVERDENVNGVMLVRSQDEENAKEIENPGQCVNKIPAPRSVCKKGKERKMNSCPCSCLVALPK